MTGHTGRPHRTSVAVHRTATGIFRGAADRHDEGTAWPNLAVAQAEADRFGGALTAAGEAVAAHIEPGRPTTSRAPVASSKQIRADTGG